MADARTRPDLPPADEAAWRRLVERALDGRPFETLISHTFEGLEIQPLYLRATTEGPRAFRQKTGAWKISQRIDHPDAATANLMARADLDGGADALTLTITGAPAARGFGVAITSDADLETTLQNIDLDRVPLRVEAGARGLEIARHLRSLAQHCRLTSAALDVDFGHDPIGHLARAGALTAIPEDIGREAIVVTRSLRDSGFSGHLLLADGRPYHEAGAGEAQELACVLSTALAYLRLLEANGLTLEEARAEIAFLLVADAEEFLTIAKFRAMRRLWASIESACGLTPKPIRIHAETAYRMMAARDPWTNIFRTTLAVFSAAIGGADTITVLPFTLALGLPDELARRLARNTQLVLIHEANLAKLADPAAGSGAFETLTENLCTRAWALFQRVETQGGMIASLEAGLPQAEIAETAAARRAAIARRRLAITGTSAFPDLSEAPVRVLDAVRTVPIEIGAPAAISCSPLPSRRDSEPFELLRLAADAVLARTGTRPKVFLVSLGSGRSVAAPTIFAQDFFALAGLETQPCTGLATAQDAAAGFSLSGCRIACICASESVSDETNLACIHALRAAGAAGLYYAGAPSEIDQVMRQGGIIEVITPGCDVVSLLQHALALAA